MLYFIIAFTYGFKTTTLYLTVATNFVNSDVEVKPMFISFSTNPGF